MLELHRVRLEELPAGRHIIEEIPYAEISTSRSCYLLSGKMLRVCKIHLTAHFILLAAGLESDLRHCRNRSKGFTAESEGEDIMQVLRSGQFRGRMTLEA